MSSVRYLDLWRIRSGAFIKLCPEVLDVFVKYAQLRPGMPESGGILLGYVRGDHIEILEATEPTKEDKRSMFFFMRRPRGHKEIASRRWAESEGLIRYLGEWHTHPEDHPTPSGLDRREWRNSASKRIDKRPQLGIIVGRTTLHLEMTTANGDAELCTPELL